MIHHRPQTFDPNHARRDFLITSAAIDGSLMLSLNLPVGGPENVGTRRFSPNAFIRIDRDGRVFLTLSDVGGGQNSRTSILRLVAEELEIALSQVHFKPMLWKEEFCFNQMLPVRAEFSNSEAICSAWKPLREAAATARIMLVAAAAERWDVDTRCCHAYEGEVIHTATWRKLSYGKLAAEAALIQIPKNVALKRLGAAARMPA